MTEPNIPTLVGSWRGPKYKQWSWKLSYLVNGIEVAFVLKNKRSYRAIARVWPYVIDSGIYMFADSSRHTTLKRAKTAAIKAAQAEWKKFATQLCTPPPSQ